MKALRTTAIFPDLDTVVTVVRAANDAGALSVRHTEALASTFHYIDVFEVPDDCERAMVAAIAAERQTKRNEIERNMAILYYYDAAALAILNDGGLLSTSQPSPLSVEDVAYTLKQLARHPDYRGQRIVCEADDSTLVTLHAGEIVEPAQETST